MLHRDFSTLSIPWELPNVSSGHLGVLILRVATWRVCKVLTLDILEENDRFRFSYEMNQTVYDFEKRM